MTLADDSRDRCLNAHGSTWEGVPMDRTGYGVNYYGDSVLPAPGEHDLRSLVVEAVSRLPADVREWLLEDTNHVFIGGYGQDAEYMELAVHPSEFAGGFARIRLIYLSERLAARPRDEVLWTVAHEIAHSRLAHAAGGYDAECDADDLVRAWGFAEPPDRGHEREKYPRSAQPAAEQLDPQIEEG